MSDAPTSDMAPFTKAFTTSPQEGPMFYLGSLPLGSRFKIYNPSTDLHMVSGYLLMVNVSRTRVIITEEGDANFLGSIEDKTLQRIYALNQEHTFQLWTPAEFEGVDEDVRRAVMDADDERDQGIKLLNYYVKER